MSTYERDYSTLEGNAKRAKALEDIVAYLGWEKFTEVCFAAQEDRRSPTGLTEKQFRFACVLGGVQGYPATVWWQLLTGEDSQ